MTSVAPVLVLGFLVLMLLVGRPWRRGVGLGAFLVSNRRLGVATGALSVAATWIWAPALFVASQKAFEQGAAGLFWFTVPNVGCLILFAFLAKRIRQVFPAGHTLPEYIAHRYDAPTHCLYLCCFLALQVCSLAVQLIAGGELLRMLSGLPYPAAVVLLVAVFTSYSISHGLQASVRTDVAQMVLILAGLACLVPAALGAHGGWSGVAAGWGGVSGRFGNPFNPEVAYTFGITVTIGLLAGPIGDQQHWQRAFAFAPGKVVGGYVLGAACFALVPLGMGLLGFLAAGSPEIRELVAAGEGGGQEVGVVLIRHLGSGTYVAVLLVMMLAGLASTGDSALCAASSLAGVDLYRRYLRPHATEAQVLRFARGAMLVGALLGVGIALIPGMSILALFLFYGTLRSATMLPTILTLYRADLTARGVFWGIALAIGLGLPLYSIGAWTGNAHLRVGANLVILLASGLVPWFGRRARAGGTVTDERSAKSAV